MPSGLLVVSRLLIKPRVKDTVEITPSRKWPITTIAVEMHRTHLLQIFKQCSMDKPTIYPKRAVLEYRLFGQAKLVVREKECYNPLIFKVHRAHVLILIIRIFKEEFLMQMAKESDQNQPPTLLESVALRKNKEQAKVETITSRISCRVSSPTPSRWGWASKLEVDRDLEWPRNVRAAMARSTRLKTGTTISSRVREISRTRRPSKCQTRSVLRGAVIAPSGWAPLPRSRRQI